MDCPICKASGFDNMLLHISDVADERHLCALDSLITLVSQSAQTQYAFEITTNLKKLNKEIVTTEGMVPTFTLLCEDPASLTSLISRLIVAIGYNRRKCVGSDRVLNNDVQTLVISDLVPKIRPLLPQILKRCFPRRIMVNPPDPSMKIVPNTLIINTASRVEVTKIFTFAAAHHLPNHPRLCQYTHGHEWKLEVTISGPVDPLTNMVMDFSDLKALVKTNIIDVLDHNYVNDMIWNPTAENLCEWIKDELITNGLITMHKIKLWEAQDSFAELKVSKQNNKSQRGL